MPGTTATTRSTARRIEAPRAPRADGRRVEARRTRGDEPPAPRSGGRAPAAGEKSGGVAGKSAIHARITQKTHPHRFTKDGQLKWKVPPPGVKVIQRKKGEPGTWIEKWQSPTTGKWVHNYTAAEIEKRAGAKFAANLRFGRSLPDIRAAVARDVKGDDKKAVIALIVALIDQAYFRVGNEGSAAENEHYGATTLLKKHLRFRNGQAIFKFDGKSGNEWVKVVGDERIVAMLKELHGNAKGREAHLFAFAGRAITNGDVNAYLGEFGATAKNFRTWHATRLFREHARKLKPPSEENVRKAIEQVAAQLVHEWTTCRDNYVDPAVVKAYLRGTLR